MKYFILIWTLVIILCQIFGSYIDMTACEIIVSLSNKSQIKERVREKKCIRSYHSDTITEQYYDKIFKILKILKNFVLLLRIRCSRNVQWFVSFVFYHYGKQVKIKYNIFIIDKIHGFLNMLLKNINRKSFSNSIRDMYFGRSFY